MKDILMTPGPVEMSDEVIGSIGIQPVIHYGKEWAKTYIKTCENFSKIMGSDGLSFLIPGSGSLGIESAVASFCRSRKCLILNNGYFGDRIYDIATKYTDNFKQIKFPLKECIDPEEVKKTLKEGYEVVLLTHVDTSTGVLNPIDKISKVAKDHGATVIVDAVASGVIERLEMDNWKIDVVINASQKGFECQEGITIVTVNNDMISYLKKTSPKAWYIDLRTWLEFYEKWSNWHPSPVTIPTNTILALKKSMELIEAEGLNERQRMFKDISERFIKALTVLGLELFPNKNNHAHGLTAVTTKGLFAPADVVDFLRKTLNIQIAGSFGELKPHVLRIGHMSKKQCETIYLVGILNGIALFMKSLGLKASIDKAISEIM